MSDREEQSEAVRIRVLLADDQALVRGALAALLGLEPDLDVVAEVGRGDEVLAAARDHQADVCLLDIEMPGADGIEVARLLATELPGCRSLMVTTFGRPGYLRRAMDAGERVLDPALAADSLSGGPNPLTVRERDVLREALEGVPAAVIAARLHLSAGTVRNYLSSAIGKTGTTTRVAAARTAQRHGWL